MALTNDIVARIVKNLPFNSSYDVVCEIFPGLKGNDYACDFAEDYIWKLEASSKARDDLPQGIILKKKNPYNPIDQSFIVDVRTPVFTALPQGFDRNKSLHKVNVWKELYEAGCVGSYWVRLVQRTHTEFESFEVIFDIMLDKIEIEAVGYEANWRLILDGYRMCKLDHPNYYLNPRHGHESTEYTGESIITINRDYGMMIRETDQLGIGSNDFDIGLSKEQLSAFLN